MKKQTWTIVISLVLLALIFTTIHISCTSYSSKVRSHKLNYCVDLQVKVLLFLARLEEGSNKLDIMPTNHPEFKNTYVSKEYNYTINYPDTWTIEQYETDGHETIYLYNKAAKALIEIGLPQGSLCANKGCDDFAGTLYTPFGNEVLTKSFVFTHGFLNFPTGTLVEEYGFFSNMDPLNPGDLPLIKSIFADEAGGTEVANVLDTITVAN